MSTVLAFPPVRRVVPALAVGLALVLSACSAPSTDPEPSAPVTASAPVAVVKDAAPAPVVPPRWPLTGAQAAEVPVRPALAIKIENSVDARPQTGLDQADVVWEQVVEGGITRFVAVYHSQVPEEVGPIRSVRPMDPAIAAPLHGLIAFSGGQPPFVQALQDAGLQLISMDKGAAGFYRKKGVGPAPHNVYGVPATFWAAADGAHQAAPGTQFAFAKQPGQSSAEVAGNPVGTINVKLSGGSHPTWTWDAGTGTFLRSEGSTPATVRSGARLAATNVVTVMVQVRDSGAKDPAGNPVPETLLDGTGDATVSSGGKLLSVRWTKSGQAEPLVLTTTDGAPVTLAAGTTWVELVPQATGSVTAG